MSAVWRLIAASLALAVFLAFPVGVTSHGWAHKPHKTPAPTVAATLPPTPAPTAAPTSAPTPTVPPTPAPTATPSSGWVTVVNDQFDSGGVPSHWALYDGPYGSAPQNCAAPSHAFVSGGYLHLLMSYEATGAGSAGCGPGWYTAGMALIGYSSVDERITLRFRVVNTDPSFHSHFNLPMRWPDIDSSWPAAGEEDYFEGDWENGISTFLHYGATNQQIASPPYGTDVTAWHTIQTTRLNNVVTVSVDGVIAWQYAGDATTLPDTLKHVVLQQECSGLGCPSGTTGTEDIQIDWITVENPG